MGRVHCEAWQAAYRGIMPDDYLDGLDPDDRAARWQGVLDANPLPAEGRRLVAELDDDIVGIALVWPDTSDPASGLGELVLINVAPHAWGRGAGTALLRACCNALAELGHDQAILWVADGNARARRFYEREGWHLDGGARTEDVGGAPIVEVRYRIDLGPFRSDSTVSQSFDEDGSRD